MLSSVDISTRSINSPKMSSSQSSSQSSSPSDTISTDSIITESVESVWNEHPLSISSTIFVPSEIQSVVDTTDYVSKYITPDIRLTDSDGDIRLFHYIYCDDSSSDDVSSCRGIIRNKDVIQCKTFGYTPEISCDNTELVKSYINSFSSCKVYDSEEGATIRLWFDGESEIWRVSTHRKISAYHSRWGNPHSRSFGDMFQDALKWECVFGLMKDRFKTNEFDEYTSTLDKNKNYTFIVRNSSENRIVCEADVHPQAYFIGSFDRSTHFLVEGNDSGFPSPRQHEFSTVDELISYVSDIDYRKKQGVIVYLPNQKQVKIMNQTYLDFFEARGNEPSIKFRYLQIRHDLSLVSMLYILYPDLIPTFESYETILSNISRKVYNAYVDRYIHHKFVTLPKPEFFILQECHDCYIKNRNEKISLERVINTIESQSPTCLNRLIKLYTHPAI